MRANRYKRNRKRVVEESGAQINIPCRCSGRLRFAIEAARSLQTYALILS